MMKVMIFEGGEELDDETYTVELLNWSIAQVQIAFIGYFDEGWAASNIAYIKPPTSMISTIEIINPTIATAMTDNHDHGVTYMVRVEEET